MDGVPAIGVPSASEYVPGMPGAPAQPSAPSQPSEPGVDVIGTMSGAGAVGGGVASVVPGATTAEAAVSVASDPEGAAIGMGTSAAVGEVAERSPVDPSGALYDANLANEANVNPGAVAAGQVHVTADGSDSPTAASGEVGVSVDGPVDPVKR
jgi:hypothetical protein